MKLPVYVPSTKQVLNVVVSILSPQVPWSLEHKHSDWYVWLGHLQYTHRPQGLAKCRIWRRGSGGRSGRLQCC